MSPGYEPSVGGLCDPGAICNKAELTGKVGGHEESPNINFCVNAEGPESLLGAGRDLSQCLEPDASGVVNLYDEGCEYFGTCSAAKAQFKASVDEHGIVTCVNFVVAAMRCAGIPVPHASHAYQWYSDYQGESGFTVYENGTSLPQEGDIICFEGGADGYGHLGIVVGVDTVNNKVEYYHANSGTKIGALTIGGGGKIETPPGSTYNVQGFISVMR